VDFLSQFTHFVIKLNMDDLSSFSFITTFIEWLSRYTLFSRSIFLDLRLVVLSVLSFLGKVKSWSGFLCHHSSMEFLPCHLILDIWIVPLLSLTFNPWQLNRATVSQSTCTWHISKCKYALEYVWLLVFLLLYIICTSKEKNWCFFKKDKKRTI